MPQLTIVVCENPQCRRNLTAGRSDTRFCGPACKQAAYRVRLRAKKLRKFQATASKQAAKVKFKPKAKKARQIKGKKVK